MMNLAAVETAFRTEGAIARLGRGALVAGALGVGANTALSLEASNGNGPGAALASELVALQHGPAGLAMEGALGGLAALVTIRGSIPTRAGVFAGAALGMAAGILIGRGVDRALNHQWYSDANAQAHKQVAKAQQFFAAHHADTSTVGAIPIVIDRSFHNAAFTPKDWHGERIYIGRYENGTSFTASPDVLFHEYGHRIIGHYAPNLAATGSSGAINEGLADTFAACIDDANWTLGEGGGSPIRNLEDPGSITFNIGTGERPYPATRWEYVNTTSDRGGVHLNATIVGHASYLIGTAIGRDKLADLYMHVLSTHELPAQASFQNLATAAGRSAAKLWGADSAEHAAVVKAWTQTGYPPA